MTTPFWPNTLTIIAGVICTLGIFSLLYRENPVYRFFEHLYIGLATGYTIVRAWQDILLPKFWDPLASPDPAVGGRWWLIFAALFGLLYYTTYVRRFAWMSRLLIATLMGFGAGLVFQGIAAEYGPQIGASFVPLLPRPGVTIYQVINNWVITFTLLCVMVYFFFAFEQQNRGVQRTAKMGRWLLMISFGAIFGQTVMARMALATGRLNFLYNDTGFLDWIRRVF